MVHGIYCKCACFDMISGGECRCVLGCPDGVSIMEGVPVALFEGFIKQDIR